MDKKRELERHKKFNDFLEGVVNDKSDSKEFGQIEDLQTRFINLKSANQKLMEKKQAINKEMEDARAKEVRKVEELKNALYEKQREMHKLQQELEKVIFE